MTSYRKPTETRTRSTQPRIVSVVAVEEDKLPCGTAERQERGLQQAGVASVRCSSVTAPRQIIPGHFYLVIRRCTQRQFLLRPSRITNEIVSCALALAACQTGVLLHAACFMSNRWRGVVSDPEGRLPDLERFHRLVARAQNASLGRWEDFWFSDKASVVSLARFRGRRSGKDGLHIGKSDRRGPRAFVV